MPQPRARAIRPQPIPSPPTASLQQPSHVPIPQQPNPATSMPHPDYVVPSSLYPMAIRSYIGHSKHKQSIDGTVPYPLPHAFTAFVSDLVKPTYFSLNGVQ